MNKAISLLKISEIALDSEGEDVNDEGRKGLLDLVYNRDKEKKVQASDFQMKREEKMRDGLGGFKDASSGANGKEGVTPAVTPPIQKVAIALLKATH